MDKIFTVELTSEVEGRQHYASLDLPATDWEALDALERLQVTDDRNVRFTLCQIDGFPGLMEHLKEGQGLFDLNGLARKLVKMESPEVTAFDGLVRMESRRVGGKIGLPGLINLAYSANDNHCHVLPDVLNDAQLGRFYAENGFIPEVEALPDDAFEMLDFEKLGRNARLAERGVHVPRTYECAGGYVVRDGDVRQVYSPQRFVPAEPKDDLLLEFTNDSARIETSPPFSPRKRMELKKSLGAVDLNRVDFRCVDCSVPRLIDAVTASGDLPAVERLAEALDSMNAGERTRLKALVDATGCADVAQAAELAEDISQHILSPRLDSEEAVARKELDKIVDSTHLDTLLPFVNLHRYGSALLQRENATLTGYGLVERRDGQPILRETDHPGQGGMEMM